MFNFINLTHEGKKVLINKENIIMIMMNNDGQTYLRLTHGHGIIVSESIDEIESMI